ncbi:MULTISPECIES: cytochrome b [unclassified Brucella]|uniref:cytochrome b n=1 Tax=unclassified Brucella TaxID=2632610 RepID=UPI000972CE5D|nr:MULTISPECIES: cytochrome b [unclassified Brucella]APX68200.1 cytochrome B [Brucella sp. 09RB8471]MRN78047.1 cytochrome b [Brucella sp. 10RB9210]CAB4326310.1 cytochrome b561 [Brucella sp. 191011898]
MTQSRAIFDSPIGYGVVSRVLHWAMALMFAWQFTSAILHYFAKGSAIFKFFWAAHFQLGFALLLLVLIRGVWGLINCNRRPRAESSGGKIVALGHGLIYILMIAVPTVAMLRSYNSGRGFSFLGMEIFAKTAVQNPAGGAPAAAVNAGMSLHGLLGWILLAVVIVHILLALAHHFIMQDNTLRYMTGRRAVS